ncbi:MAG: glycosyltransferase family 2 protein [Cyclobacteriaceae bacterium]|nr:glycosyltransferase family 2 protein [Cyclobacteriaceae bacterium]
MLFEFQKYIYPTWYYNWPGQGSSRYWVDVRSRPEAYDQVKLDSGYHSEGAAVKDAAYQAINGELPVHCSRFLGPDDLKMVTDRKDNYRFARKYVHGLWSVYILVIRLFTLHNPFLEISAFWKSRKVPRFIPQREFKLTEELTRFESPLLAESPLVTVIIPTLNRYVYLKDALLDLQAQDYGNFEVVVVDQTENFLPAFYEGWKMKVTVIHQLEKALWKARNDAVTRSSARYLLLFDDDSRVAPDWIRQHLKCLDFFKVDISSGISLSKVGDAVPYNYSFFRWSDQLDTGNVMIRRSVFEKIGLFDRQFEKQRMGDAEFGFRAYSFGFENVSNPLAMRIHLKVNEGGLRQMGSWDAYRPTKWFAPKPVPSVLYYYRKYFGNEMAVYELLKRVPFSMMPYWLKKSKVLKVLSFPLALLLSPIALIQVALSWRLASEKLNAGAKIEVLEAQSADQTEILNRDDRPGSHLN